MKNNTALLAQLEASLLRLFPVLATPVPASPVPAHLLLALSGGIDSMVLLHALQQLSQRLPFTLSAMHVHHGLSPHADRWLQVCQQTCIESATPFYVEKIHVDQHSGQGIEAAARAGRYRVLEQSRSRINATAIVTAHHAQDQAETLLLQLVRGAGAKGLSAMPDRDDNRKLWRPMLGISKADIQAYAEQHALQWVEDESNADLSYDRNYMRQQVMPVMRARYPQLDQSLGRSALHLAETQQLLHDLAQQDLHACDLRPEWQGQSIDIVKVQSLGDVRARNLLRGWFDTQALRMPNTEQLQDYWQQLATVKPHRYLLLPLQGPAASHAAYLHHYQGRLYCVGKPPVLPQSPLIWLGGRSQIWGNWQVEFKVAKGRGIALAKLGISPAAITLHRRYAEPLPMPAHLQLLLHARAGGETLQPDVKRPRRELKVIFQMLGTPPWQRAFYPLISVQSASGVSREVVALSPDIVDASWATGRNAYGLVLSLHPITPSPENS